LRVQERNHCECKCEISTRSVQVRDQCETSVRPVRHQCETSASARSVQVRDQPRQSVGNGCKKSICPWAQWLLTVIAALRGGFEATVLIPSLWRGVRDPCKSSASARSVRDPCKCEMIARAVQVRDQCEREIRASRKPQ
jgi:hypothetical protein